ncbi:hypothetical protein G6F24_013156 [Rhizopus arrhizus]|nr:hypothetical protein G6F24_013156 [Rhizopus arrhizus]
MARAGGFGTGRRRAHRDPATGTRAGRACGLQPQPRPPYRHAGAPGCSGSDRGCRRRDACRCLGHRADCARPRARHGTGRTRGTGRTLPATHSRRPSRIPQQRLPAPARRAGCMSARPSRAWLGNALVLLLLALVGWALLRLHLGEAWWQGAPPARQSQVALIATALYALACAALWWRGRPRDAAPSGDTAPILRVWASQTGFARELAERSAEALRGAGVPVRVRGLHEVDAALLTASQRALFIASTTGEGDPPDHALPFLRGVMTTPPPMQHLHYGVLALGDRSYGHFCGFGHQLDQWLRQHGAHPLFDAIEVDNADPAALRHWQQLLGQLGGGASELPDWSPAEYQPWTLLQREHLNPGSPGGPVYWLRLQPPAGAAVQWQAGDIAGTADEGCDW